MPYAERRKADALNRAYAFLSEPSFGAAARSLVDKLVAIGFEEYEALDNIEPAQKSFPEDDSLFAQRPKTTTTFNQTVSAKPAADDRPKNKEAVTLRETDDEDGESALHGRGTGKVQRAFTGKSTETALKG